MQTKQAVKKTSACFSLIWRLAQVLVWVLGLAIVFCLFLYPDIGLTALWNILIPVAPAVLVLICGVWRNVCPLATTSLVLRHSGLSRKKKMTAKLQGKLQLAGVILLFLLVPLRHIVFNKNGLASGILLCSLAATAAVLGYFYDWKSAWCNGLCPVHPVEKLYGQNTLFMPPNAHCHLCVNCSVPCPDSTPNVTPLQNKKSGYSQLSGILITGGLPGFILGWFSVPDLAGNITMQVLFEVYKQPLAGFCVTLLIYLVLKRYTGKKREPLLARFFAAAGVSCYYWFRIPALLGLGRFSNDVSLVNLRGLVPQWAMLLWVSAITIFFFWWLVYRKPNRLSWQRRPAYATRQKPAD